MALADTRPSLSTVPVIHKCKHLLFIKTFSPKVLPYMDVKIFLQKNIYKAYIPNEQLFVGNLCVLEKPEVR